MKSNRNSAQRICMIGMMAAIVFVSNFLRIPFMDTKLTAANALCAISGLLFGPWGGFAAAGLGSFLFDLLTGYGAESLITLVSKGVIALVAALIAGKTAYAAKLTRGVTVRVVLSCAVGALCYVALYMLKTFLFGLFINGLTYEATLIKMSVKLPGSLLNALFAAIAGPVLFFALRPVLRYTGVRRE